MKAVTAFEHRREQLLEQLTAAENIQQAVLACTMALEQTACELAQDEQDEAARQRQQAVMAIVRRVPSVLQAAGAKGEMVVSGGQEQADTAGQGFRIAGVVVLCAFAVYEYITGSHAAALIQALGVLLFTAGCLRLQRPKEEAVCRGVALIDPKAAVMQLAQLCEAADVCVEDLMLLENSGVHARLSGTADDAMLDLLVALMEAKASGRDELAMRSLSLAEEYLHMLDVEIAAYSDEHAAMFDILPALSGVRTVRPALVKEGKVIRRGVAAVAGERGVGV